ncbi:MAG: DUF1800 domain-containing protein [Gammaproteobacteria bacterium]|nr:DUF1800 domain-containing protein [Gammaproteobacteria bacterium]MDP6166341.1 DUF1800 family protein [Gammaproteobacteria bacterium]
MNEHFRISQKVGLLFRYDQPLPSDMQAWLKEQLQAASPALGIANRYTGVSEWPAELQPDLAKRAQHWRQYRTLEKQRRQGKNGQDTEAAKTANRLTNLWRNRDELKFSHRNVYGADQVKLRFTSFWTNHFTIGNTFDTGNMIGHAIDEGILAKLDGRFADMLYGITTHPGMLTYLDNVWSAGERSEQAKKCGRRVNCQAGLNDNLGRELLELHTLSPVAGYTEDDIHSAAQVLAGWGIDFESELNEMRQQTGTSDHWDAYKKRWAEPGSKNVFGQKIYAGKGGLRQLTNFLASHEHTIDFVSTKLCRHFVSDVPQQKEIDAVKGVWRQTQGDLPAIHAKVLELAVDSTRTKFLWPMTWLFQMVRLSGATYFKGWEGINNYSNELMNTRKVFAELGQSFWSSRQPNGYSDDKAEWMSAEMFERRLRFAEAIYLNGNPKRSVEKMMDRIDALPQTRELVASVGRSPKNQFVAFMCSPELMGLEYV